MSGSQIEYFSVALFDFLVSVGFGVTSQFGYHSVRFSLSSIWPAAGTPEDCMFKLLLGVDDFRGGASVHSSQVKALRSLSVSRVTEKRESCLPLYHDLLICFQVF